MKVIRRCVVLPRPEHDQSGSWYIFIVDEQRWLPLAYKNEIEAAEAFAALRGYLAGQVRLLPRRRLLATRSSQDNLQPSAGTRRPPAGLIQAFCAQTSGSPARARTRCGTLSVPTRDQPSPRRASTP